MTAHEVAHRLLAGPDVEVYVSTDRHRKLRRVDVVALYGPDPCAGLSAPIVTVGPTVAPGTPSVREVDDPIHGRLADALTERNPQVKEADGSPRL